MECNKEEALRSRQIAERKFLQQDALAAKKFALKAQQLYPELDGIAQLIPVFEVHAVAQDKKKPVLPGAEMDWYGILQVNHNADEASIRKQYRKLALLLHPDKNKCMGAEAAFKLVVEAWRILSDKACKSAYDMRRNRGVPPTSVVTNVHSTRQSYSQSHSVAASVSSSFWTSCPTCKMQYEYLRIYENRNLCCPFCHMPFLAREIKLVNAWWSLHDPPPAFGFVQKPSFPPAGTDFSWEAYKTTPPTPHPHPHPHPPTPPPTSTFEKVKKEQRVEIQRETKKKEVKEKDQRKRDRELLKAQEVAKAKEVFVQMMAKARSVFDQKTPVKKEDKNIENTDQSTSLESSKPDAEPAKLVKNKEASKSETKSGNHRKSPSGKTTSKSTLKKPIPSKQLRSPNGEESPAPKKARIENNSPKVTDSKDRNSKKDAMDNCSEANPYKVKPLAVSIDEDGINVPDPDFYNFDKDRTEACFVPGQVWAIYDENDGMPRYYAQINKVTSTDPFKVQMSWVEPRPLSKEIVNWNKSGLQCPCGEFKAGKNRTSEFINTFSHTMESAKGSLQGVLKIYPRKGDVWALHQGWTKAMRPKNVSYVYDIVEILSDFKEKEGVRVMPLKKVDGYNTVYRNGKKEVEYLISSKDLLRFSHRVPAHRLTLEEAPSLKEGSWELDPGAIPPIMLISRPGNEEPNNSVNPPH